MKSLSDKNWKLVGYYRQCPLMDWICTKGWKRKYFKKVRCDIEFKDVLWVDHECYVTKKEEALLDSFVKERINDKKFISQYLEKCEKGCKHLILISKNIQNIDLKSLSDEELVHLFKTWVKIFTSEMHFYMDMMSFERILTERFKGSYIASHRNSMIHDEIHNVDTMIKITKSNDNLTRLFKTKPAEEILSILRLYKDPILNLIQKHKELYCWMNTYGWNGRLLTEKDYVKRIKENLHIKKNGNRNKKITRFIDHFYYMKTRRDEVYNYVGYLIRPLLEEIATRYNLSYDEIIYLTDDEIINFDNQIKDIIKERKEHYIILKHENSIKIICGKKAKRIKNYLFPKKIKKKEIKGDVAHIGNISGNAKVVMYAGEIGKVEENDILVTPMTNFNYLPIMHKVSGIITDEGGVMCHSAIVAREYGIPCITGTVIATKVFKDGDLIEVDAEKGIVRKR